MRVSTCGRRRVEFLFLLDHELLERVEISRDEGADGLVVVVEDLLSSSLGAGGAGRPHQAGVRSAVTLTDKPQES